MADDKNKTVTLKKVTLYVGSHCHLCEQARQLISPVLDELGWQCEEVSITDDTDLMALYGLRIPVLKTPGSVEKGWPFAEGQVRRLLQAES